MHPSLLYCTQCINNSSASGQVLKMSCSSPVDSKPPSKFMLIGELWVTPLLHLLYHSMELFSLTTMLTARSISDNNIVGTW